MGDNELAALASRQHSLVTRRQARDHLSRDQVLHRLAAGLPRPVQQFEVVAGDAVYHLDFSYPDLYFGMEYDSFTFHRLPTDLERAAVRNNGLELAGWRMLQFTKAYPRRRIVADVRAARARSFREKGGSDPNVRDCQPTG